MFSSHRYLPVCLLAAAALPLRLPASGIPEPDLVLYGAVNIVQPGTTVRLGYGTLNWVFQPVAGGSPITATATLTNINNQFSYILRIPCESDFPPLYPASSNVIKLTTAGVAYNRSQVTWNTNNALTFALPALTNITISVLERGRMDRIDLTLAIPLSDSNGNGIPDAWEFSNFGKLVQDPHADPDHDGMDNLAEYRAGTDPNDPASGLRFTEIRPEPGGISLKWLSAPDRAYALQRSPSPEGSYWDIRTGIASTAPLNSYLDTTATGYGPYYYRLRIDDLLSVAAPPLQFISLKPDVQGGLRLSWFSTANTSYTLERSTNLTSHFLDLQTGIAGTPPTNTFRDATANGSGPFFYRLRLEP